MSATPSSQKQTETEILVATDHVVVAEELGRGCRQRTRSTRLTDYVTNTIHITKEVPSSADVYLIVEFVIVTDSLILTHPLY